MEPSTAQSSRSTEGAALTLVSILVTTASIALFAQSLWSIYLMLYSWEHPDRLQASRGPSEFLAPRLSFSVLLPARHEEAVIGETIRRVSAANYPAHLVETVVVCHSDDAGTIAVADRVVEEIGSNLVRIEAFSGGPINKAHSLNVGLARSGNHVVTVFDAEDDIDPDIFNIVNTVMLQEDVGIVQGGVQLMNFRDHWFSIHNCLEYFFWFKSNLHLHAHMGMIPLGGNTVFIQRHLLGQVDGWDEGCLTEDADIGLRLSALGERIKVVYDARHVTREETPHSVRSFVMQRTRWHQGFLQVLRKGAWRRLPRKSQQLLAIYTFSRPVFEGLLTMWLPLTFAQLFWLKLPLPIAILSTFPLYALLFQFLIGVAGAWVFSSEYGLTLSAFRVARMAFTFLPFQSLLGISAARAVYREGRGINSWEKTGHTGSHREHEPTASALAGILEEMVGRFGADRASLLETDGAGHSFKLVSNSGIYLDAQTRRSLEGLAGWTARTRTPLLIGGGPLPEEVKRLLPPEGVGSAVVVPVHHSGRLAVLTVSSMASDTHMDEDALQWLTQRIS